METNSKKISEALAGRLPVYYRHIKAMAAKGRKSTTSAELAEKAGNTATQVRQDFFTCGGTENYHVDNLEKWLEEKLGINKKHHVIVIGGGNLGRAIISYKDFEKDGFFIDAAFDNNLLYEGINICGVPILNINMLESFISANNVDIAVITTPADAAEKIAEKLIELGVKGIWNFAPCDLKSTESCTIRNIQLTDSLMVLSMRINERNK